MTCEEAALPPVLGVAVVLDPVEVDTEASSEEVAAELVDGATVTVFTVSGVGVLAVSVVLSSFCVVVADASVETVVPG